MSERKKILLDLDDTILDFHTAERHALQGAFEALGVAADDALLERYSEINRRYWRMLERGELTRAEILVGRFARLFEEKGIDCPAELAQKEYEDRLSVGHFYVPGAPELLEELVKDYDLYIVSNGNIRTQRGRLASANISGYFKGIFISELIGADKPSRAFFDACFAAIPGFRREDALIVGDSLSSDILGGVNAGVRTCWFNPLCRPPGEDVRPDYIIYSLSELPALLREIFG